jgi:hypothetical protein
MKQRQEKSVLFLCTGNFYRSRFAEIQFNSVAERMGLFLESVLKRAGSGAGSQQRQPIADLPKAEVRYFITLAEMLEAAKRVERKYSKRNLGPWDDFEWAMINGKLSSPPVRANHGRCCSAS